MRSLARVARCGGGVWCAAMVLAGCPALALQWQEEKAPRVGQPAPEGAPAAVIDAWGRVLTPEGGGWQLLAERSQHRAKALLVDEDGSLWVGWDDGVSHLRVGPARGLQSWDWVALGHGFVSSIYETTESGPMGEIELLAHTSHGLVAASRTQGLMVYGPYYRLWDRYFAHFTGANSPWVHLPDWFPHKRVLCLLEEPQGDLWFGTGGDGIVRVPSWLNGFARRGWGYYAARNDRRTTPSPERYTAASNGLPSDEVTAVASGPKGTTWFGFGGEGGVAWCRYGSDWQVTRPGTDGLPAGAVRALAGDGAGRVWAAVEAADGKAGALLWHDAEGWHREPGPPPGNEEGLWPAIGSLTVVPPGRLVARLPGAAAWVAEVPLPPAPVAEAEGAAPPAAEGLRPATPAAGAGGFAGAAELLAAVAERNRAWLSPPRGVTSLEYRHHLKPCGLQRRIRWQAPHWSDMAICDDPHRRFEDLRGLRWAVLDEQSLCELAAGGGGSPLRPGAPDLAAYEAALLTGAEISTALHLLVRTPEAWTLGMAPEPTGYRLEGARTRRLAHPHAAPGLFWTCAGSLDTWPEGKVVVHLDGRVLVPLTEEWFSGNGQPTATVTYGDWRRTPDGGCVPLEIKVQAEEGNWEGGSTWHFAWHQPGLWLLSQGTTRPGYGGEMSVTVSDVRVNEDLKLAQELGTAREGMFQGQAGAAELLASLAAANAPWLGAKLDPAFAMAQYHYELRNAEGTLVDVRDPVLLAGQQQRFSPVLLGATLPLPAAAVLQDPAAFSPRITRLREDRGRRIVTLRLTAPQPQRALYGNGLQGVWVGYAGAHWQELELEVDTQRNVPLRARAGDWEQTYDDFREVRAGQFVPLTVRVRGVLSFDLSFIWAGDCLWIARETATSWPERDGRAVARLTNLAVNGRPVEGVPVLTAEELRRAEAELAAHRTAEQQRH